MKRAFGRVLLVLLGLAVAGGLFVWAGIYNVSARAGHLPPTAWLLHFAMRASARTHAFGIEVPALDDPGMIVRGATYFSIGCAACHGEPGNPNPPIVREMTPPAPALAPLVEEWTVDELFWIVDNGIKYTGMPAWATPHRPDEVWSMVAFLLALPGMDTATYRTLAYEAGSRPAPGPAITSLQVDEKVGSTLQQCARCHGLDGMGRGSGAFPYLAGQSASYLYEALRQYAAGSRASGIMQPIAGGLLDDAMRDLARHFSQARPVTPALQPSSGEGRADRGEAIVKHGLAERRIAACAHCHGPGAAARNGRFPNLAGQNEAYLVRQLELWAAGKRGGGEFSDLMAAVASGLDSSEIRDIAAYYASLPYFGD